METGDEEPEIVSHKTETTTIDVSGLSPAQLKKIERALKPHETVFSRRFVESDIAAWRRCAEHSGESATVWIARHLNAAAAKEQELGAAKKSAKRPESLARDTVLSLRFAAEDIELWKSCADARDESDTEWVERHLNRVAKRELARAAAQTAPRKK